MAPSLRLRGLLRAMIACVSLPTVGGIHAAFVLPPNTAYTATLPLAHGLLDAGHNVTFVVDDWSIKKVQALVPAANFESIGPTVRPEMNEKIMDFFLSIPLPANPLFVNFFVGMMDTAVGLPMAKRALPILREKKVDVLCAVFMMQSVYALGEVLDVPVVGHGLGLLTTSILTEITQPAWSLVPVFGSHYTSEEVQSDVRLILWNTAMRLFGQAARNSLALVLTNVNRKLLGAPGFLTSQFEHMFTRPLINPTLPELSPVYPAWTSYIGEQAGIYDHPALQFTSMAKSSEQDQILAWLDERARMGAAVLYVSFGSEVILSKRHRDLLLEAFDVGKMNVLWALKKPPADLVAPPNTYVTAWAPQKAVLAHRAVKAFLSHCGGNSAREALQAGMPVLGIPYFGDQVSNAVFLEELGVAIKLHRDYFTSESLRAAFQRIITGPYQERAAEIKAMNDGRANITRAVEVMTQAAKRRFPRPQPPAAWTSKLVPAALLGALLLLNVVCCGRCFRFCGRCCCGRSSSPGRALGNGKAKPE